MSSKASSRSSLERFPSNHSIYSQPPQTFSMASRRLALNLSKGLSSRAGLSAAGALKRGFATPSHAAGTQTTTLKNGLTVSIPTWPKQPKSSCAGRSLTGYTGRDRSLALGANVYGGHVD